MVKHGLAVTLTLCLLIAATAAESGVEMTFYGDSGQRDTNLTSPAYVSEYGGGSETRLVLVSAGHPARPRPYIKLNMAWSSEDIPDENTITRGVGVELRPFSENTWLENAPLLDWLTRARLFVEYGYQSHLRSPKREWVPHEDVAVGLDIWREYGCADPRWIRPHLEWEQNRPHYWGELNLRVAHHSTNFFIEGYNSTRTVLNLKAGCRIGETRLPVMPYLVADFVGSSSGYRFYWENRLLGGVGVRTEIPIGRDSKVKLYMESVRVIGYLKDKPSAAADVADYDVRGGIICQVNRY